MLQAHQIHRSFGVQDVLRGATFQISRGEKVGLIGRNGCGKSPLLRILADRDQPDRGHVSITHPGVVIGDLPQEPDFGPETTVAICWTVWSIAS